MASGTLGQADLAATTNTTVYTVPTGKVATFNVSFCNRTTSTVYARLAIAASGTPGNTEFINYDAAVPGNCTLERTGLVASAAKQIVAYASAAGLSVNVYGFED